MWARWVAITLVLGAAASAAEPPSAIDEAAARQLQALSSRASYPLDARWSVDMEHDAGAPADAYVPGTAIDTPRPRTRLTLSLNLAPGARVQPYVGAGIEDENFERFSPARPFETDGNDLAHFAATVVGGFDVDAGEGWSMKFKADAKKVSLGMKVDLN